MIQLADGSPIDVSVDRKDRKAMTLQKRAPVHPGRILLKHYVEPLNIKIVDLASNLGVSRKAVSAIVMDRHGY